MHQSRGIVDCQLAQLSGNPGLPEFMCDIIEDVFAAVWDYHLLTYLWLPQITFLNVSLRIEAVETKSPLFFHPLNEKID